MNDLSLCDRDMQITSDQNEYDFSKQLILVNMLKKELYRVSQKNTLHNFKPV